MKIGTPLLVSVAVGLTLKSYGWSQNATNNQDVQTRSQKRSAKKGRSADGDVASGSGDIAAGAAKGAGHAAAGIGKGAADLVTLHPVGAAADLGKGGAYAGKSVAVGTAKGTGKIFRGVGKGLKHIF